MIEDDIPKEFIQRYVSNRQKDLHILKEFLVEKKYSEISQKAHIIKGNAASFGFPDLGIIGIDLEKAALSGQEDETSFCLHQMSAWLETTLQNKLL